MMRTRANVGTRWAGMTVCVVWGACWLGAGGCAMFGGPPGSGASSTGKGVPLGKTGEDGEDQEQVQSELMSFTDTFVSAISQQWNQTDPGTSEGKPSGDASAMPTPGASAVKAAADKGRRASLEIKISNVSAALGIASSPNAIVGLADMITMISLERMILQDPWAAETLGPTKAAGLVAVYEEHEAKAWRIADRVFTAKQKDELRGLIDQWRKDHPDQRYVSGVRLEDFARDRGTVSLADQSAPGSLLALVGLDPLASLDPTVREVQRSRLLAERMFFYAQYAPMVLKWQTESLYTGFLQTPEVRQAIGALADVSAAADDVADAGDQLRKDLAKERHDAIADLFEQLSKERRETLDQFFARLDEERKTTLKEIDQAQSSLPGSLEKLNEAIAATRGLSESLKGTIQAADALAARVLPPPGTTPATDTGPKKDVLEQYQKAADQTSQVVEKLTTLADRVDKILAAQSASTSSANVQAAVATVQSSVQKTIDRAFWWMAALALVSALCLGAAIALGLSGHKAMERRSAAKRRRMRGEEAVRASGA